MGRKHPTVRAEKAPKKEAKAEVKAEPRKTQANWKADAPAVRREGAWTTVPPKGGPKSAEAKPKQEMKSGWLKVATAGKEARRTTTADCGKKPDGEKKPVSRGKPALRAKDWELPLIDAKLLLDESEKKAKPEGVIEATMGEGRRVLQYADELTQLETEGVRLVIVTPRSIAEDSTRELVFREDGSVEYAHVTLRGAKTAKPSGGQVTLDGDASATRVLVFTALHRELTDEKVEILRSETKGAGATDTLCARSAKGAAVTIERRHRWRHARMSDRSTCMVRVPQAHAASLLGASGHEGLFWSAPRFVEGGESHKVQWLAEDATLEEALALTALPGTHGLVPARARLGVRYSAEGEQLEALREAAGMLLAPELPDEGVAYFVTGGRNEHAEDIVQALVRAGWVGRTRKTFSKKGRTRMVVTAQSPPPAEVLRRAGRDPLHIRSSEVVLGVLEKAHLTHPATATAYRITADFYSACGRLPHLMPLMTEVRRLYGERVTAALGPVGTAVRHGLQPCGHTWNGGPPSSVNLDGAALRPLAMSASSRNHIIRDNLRNRLWKRLETRRPSFSGITNIAIESTNALWTTRHCPPQNALLIRVALAGGVNTAEYTSRFRQGGSPACTLCGSGALEDEHHVYWDCTAFENIRTKPEYAGIAQSDRRLWPSCLREHGIVTPATREFAGPVQALMAEILAERARRISVRWLERKAATPWERCAQMPTAKREFPFRRIAPAWAWLRYWDEGTFLAAIDWLSGLEWSSDGDMAAVEAAIDFELFSGLDIKAPSKAAKTHREKANGMRCMLSAINKLAVQQQLGKCLPGDFKSKTTALSFIGLSSVPGFQPRPRHRMPETGPTIMQQVKTGYGTAPAYPPERTDRARRWVIPRAPLANPDPLHLPHAVPEATKNAPKCATHHKGKCAVCRALGHHHGPTVEACCRHHHADNDGLPPAVCDRHRMTRCVECNTPTACCKAGHHDCREHARGPCDDCRGLPTLAERRPSACCKKGHHVPAPPKPAPAKPKPTTPRKKGRQKPTTPPRMKRTRQASPKAAKMAKKHAPTEPARATPPRKGQKRARLPTPPNDPAGKPGKKHAARKRNISRMELDITSPATSTSSSSMSGSPPRATASAGQPARKRNKRRMELDITSLLSPSSSALRSSSDDVFK
ncbi:hypothetical protein DIPPA_24879 [Diplonema papillatum]|nr:hypothetical protein DIPPA_24879 [Diplonema papillatum]